MSSPRPGSGPLTAREAQILAVLWENGPSTAEQVREGLPDPLHNATVRTMLRMMEKKGLVTHRPAPGVRKTTYVYRATIRQASAEKKAVKTLLKRFFDGSAAALVQRLIEDKRLTAKELETLRTNARAGKSKRGGGKAR